MNAVKKLRSSFGLTVALVLAALVLSLGAASAQTRSLLVEAPALTGKPVPVALSLDEVRRAVGLAFPIDWDSLRVYDSDGNLIPYQIDDADLSGALSLHDRLAFVVEGSARIEVAMAATEAPPAFENAFTVTETEEGWLIESKDGDVAVEVTPLGGVNLVRYAGVERSFARDIGFLRYAGFPYSTYWVNGELKAHEEKTTLEEPMRVRSVTILENSPVRATVIVQRASDLFPGLRQDAIISVYPTGEILVDQVITSAGYADLTKLETIVNAVMAGTSDARHILPVFRWLEWADELDVTPAQYWAERDVLMEVDGKSYVAFNDIGGPAPLWWGASYIFASPERWRTNHSAELGLGTAEMLLNVPEIATGLRERLEGPQWQLEGEWRNGYFRWIPEDVITSREAKGIEVGFGTDMEADDWALHLIPGDTVQFVNVYAPYEAADAADAIRYLENRYEEISGVSVTRQ